MQTKRFYFLSALILVLSATQVNSQQPKSPLVSSFSEYQQMKQSTEYGLEWVHLGPVINGALVETLAADPNKPGTMYAGFGSGNLWKTTNNGLSWKPIFEDQPSYGIGDVALAPSNSNIIYLGTGEALKKPRNFTMPGTGVYRSDDGGESWRHLGLDDSWHIGEIAIHPTNPDIVYVAVLGHFWSTNPNRGVFRSMDGGKSWKHVLYVDDKTGANDIVIAPSNPDYVYASMWQDNPDVSGKTSGIYYSTDAGETWIKSKKGLPKGDGMGRMGLAVSYSNPLKVYTLIDHRNKKRVKNEEGERVPPGAAEVYNTLDGGKSWSRTHEEDLMIFAQLGWYFADIYTDPKNDDEIYTLGVRMAHSTDGGKSFELMGGDVYHLFPSPADPLHLDHCELWINPMNSNHLVLGNDGGLYVSYDRGSSWIHCNSIPTGEFYDITLDTMDPYTIYGGVQDDATVFGKAKEWNPKFYDEWQYLWIDAWSGGDGCITVVDPVDVNTVFFSSQEGGVRRRDMTTGKSKSVRPRIDSLRGKLKYNFISPYFLSPHDHSTLYLAGNYIFKSADHGDSWKAISGDLSKGEDPDKQSLAAGAMAESEIQEGLLYMGTDKGLFWVSEDGGKNWINRSQGLPNAYIRTISPSRYNKSRVYVALSGINYDDFNTYLYVSEDNGASWKSINANLPSEVAYVLKEDPKRENILYAGLYRAAYISTDRGASWSMLGRNMPAAAVSDLEFDIKSGDLVVSTHGRGIYRTNLGPVYQKLDRQTNDSHLSDLPEFILPERNDTHRDFNMRTLNRVPITFWAEKAQEMTINVLDSSNVIWSAKIDAKKGFNQYRWDMIIDKVDSPQPYFVHYNVFIKPGNYLLTIKGDGVEMSKEILVTEPK